MAQCSPKVIPRHHLKNTMIRPHSKGLYHLIWTYSGSSEITWMLRVLEGCKQHNASRKQWKKGRKEWLATDDSLLM